MQHLKYTRTVCQENILNCTYNIPLNYVISGKPSSSSMEALAGNTYSAEHDDSWLSWSLANKLECEIKMLRILGITCCSKTLKG